MSRLELRSGKRRGRTTTVLTAGIHALVGPSEAAGDALVRAIAGERPERHQEILVDDEKPLGNPDLRRSIGTLLRREEPPEARTVEAFLRTALILRGSPADPRDVVGSFGLGDVLPRLPASLSASELRALALSLALSIERPRVLALFEPLSTGLDRHLVVERLSAHAASGAVVLCRTSSAVDAADLGATGILVLEGGKVWRTTPDLAPWFTSVCLVVTDSPRELCSALSGDPAITSVAWDEGASRGELSVTGPDAEETALAIVGAASRERATLYSVRRVKAGRPSKPHEAARRSP